jgi:hypothetical protein
LKEHERLLFGLKNIQLIKDSLNLRHPEEGFATQAYVKKQLGAIRFINQKKSQQNPARPYPFAHTNRA